MLTPDAITMPSAAAGGCQQDSAAAVGIALRRARATDPVTSKVAATKAARFAASHAGRILWALKWLGSGTAEEIAAQALLTVVQVDRRASELIRSGQVRVLTMGGKEVTRNGFRVLAAVDPCYFSSDEAHG